MAYNALNNLIDAYIYPNGVQAITGSILNNVLKTMVSQLGEGYHLMGVAAPNTSPAVNDFAMAYFAATAGTYTNFDGIVLAAGEVAVLLTSGNGSWSKQTIYNVPTGTADLANTAGFITSAVNSLVYYYTKTEIDTALSGYTTTAALATALADYYNKAAIDAQMATRYTKSEVDTKLDGYYKKTETYDKDEVDSIVAALSRQEYIVAWDGSSAPVVADIPAGVTVTYSGTTYTGTLAASASTVNKIYMVWNGVAYDMYGTSQDGGYSWVPMGSTTVDLSQYATKAEVLQLGGDVTDLRYDVGNRVRTTVRHDLTVTTWTDGKALDALQGDVAFGTQLTSSAFSITDSFDVSSHIGKKITYTRWVVGTGASTSKKYGLVFYTSSYVAIAGETNNVNGDGGFYETSEIVIPENTRYVRFSFPTDQKSNWSAYIEEIEIGDYTSGLGKELRDFEEEVQNDLYMEVDTSGLTQWKRIITSAGKWQSYSSGYLSVDIPIKPGQRVIVKANTTTALIALLKSETYTSGTTPDFCAGYTGRIVVNAGNTYKFTAPDDAAFLYTTIQSSNTNLDSQIFFYFLEEIDRNVISKVAPLCVSRYKRPDMNPNGLYYNSYIAVSRRFNSAYDSVLVFGNKDAAAVTNKFWDFFGFYVITRGEDYINTPADVTNFGTSIAASTTTDSILPVIVGAVNNIDGDNSSKWLTGQNHAYGNVAAGVTPTMREVSCDVSVDGVSVGLDNLGIRGDVCTINVVNMVQGYNTCKQDGTGREIIKQKISAKIDNDKCVIRVEYLALEDVVFYNIPGFGMYGAPNTGRKFRLIGSLTKPLTYDYNSTAVSPGASDNRINALQFSRNGLALEVMMKDVGLGNMKLNTTENNAYATNANKVYTRLTASDTEFQLQAGGLLAYEFDLLVVGNVLDAS